MPTTLLEQNLALSGFYEENPLDFKLIDPDGEELLYIVNNSFPGTTHYLLIENNTDDEVVIKELVKETGSFLADIRPGKDNYHFELRFRPGTLSSGHFGWITVGNADWRIKPWRWDGQAAIDAGIVPGAISLFLLYIDGRERLAIPPLGTFILPIQNVKAGPDGGSRGSRVELHYEMAPLDPVTGKRFMLPQPTDQPVPAGATLHHRQQRLNVLNNQGGRNLPMDASFVSSNTIINNGRTANELDLQVTNLLRNGQIFLRRRNSESPSKFILSFNTSELSEAWAIADSDNVAAFDVDIEMTGGRKVLWHVQKQLQGQSPQWIFTVSEDTILDAGEHFLLKLSGIISSMPSGFTNLYLAYENIAGYWDGQFVVPIEKSPVKFQDDISEQGNNRRTLVGIGVDNPDAELEVDGKIIAKSMDVEGKLTIDTIRFNNELAGDQITIDGKAGSVVFNDKYTIIESEVAGESILQVEGKDGIDSTSVQIKGSLSADKALSAEDSVSIGPFTLQPSANEDELQIQKAGASFGGIIPRGGIIMWSGKAGAIPAGWALCDGTMKNGLLTPDLRGRFIVGQSNDEPANGNTEANLNDYKTLDVAAGEREVKLDITEMPWHDHGFTDPGHSHTFNDKHRGRESSSGGGAANQASESLTSSANTTSPSSSNITFSGAGGDPANGNNTVAHENRPPYYVLAFIMKL